MASKAHTVGVLVFDGMKMLDLSGPAEVFSEANRYGADYRAVGVPRLREPAARVRTSSGCVADRVPAAVHHHGPRLPHPSPTT
jgi:transcriptional regulator GlxA family with amidase domain